jgi:hypothetical protein
MGADELVLDAEPVLTVKRRLVHAGLLARRRCRAIWPLRLLVLVVALEID